MSSSVYFEQCASVQTAIAREKEVKHWRREKKNKLVESLNPGWKDLAADWYPDRLLKDGVPIELNETKHKVPPAYSRADDCARSLSGRRDDE